MFVFWDREYAQSGIRDLAASMGIGLPSLYAAFGSKAQLFDEAVALYKATPQYVVVDGLDALPPREGITSMLDRAVVGYTDPAHPPGCLLVNEPRLGGERLKAQRMLEAYLAEHRDRLPVDTDPVALAAFYASILRGLSALARDGGTTEQLRSVAEMAMRSWPRR